MKTNKNSNLSNDIFHYTSGEISFVKDVCNSLLTKGFHYNLNLDNGFITFFKEKDGDSILITIDENIIPFYDRYINGSVPDSSRKFFVNQSFGIILEMLSDAFYDLESSYRV